MQGVTGSSKGLQGVTRGYRRLQEVTGVQGVRGGYRRLQRVTEGYKGLQGFSMGNIMLQGVTGGYKRLQEVTGGYKG